MASEYDPLLATVDDPLAVDDLEEVRERFEAASQPYLSQPWSWWLWSLVLPTAALSTDRLLARYGPLAVLSLWSLAVIVGGAFEATQIRRNREGSVPSLLARWVLRLQANLSLVALVLSIALLLTGQGRLLPGVWLLLLGHSFYGTGGLAFPALRAAGLLYQAGGLLSLGFHRYGLVIFAVVTFLANAWLGYAIFRRRRPGTR